MAVITKQFLSGGSANGRPIKVASTTSPGTTLHTVSGGGKDEVWLYANNTSGSAVTLTVEFGGTTNPDDRIVVGIPASQGLVLVAPGIPLNDTLVVKAFASVTDVINITGWSNRIV